jgi:hypothetical protein
MIEVSELTYRLIWGTMSLIAIGNFIYCTKELFK